MDFYAEITKKQLLEIENGTMSFLMPSGVELVRDKNSRGCYFSCDDEAAKEQLIDMLDDKGISWQEDDDEIF